jgi:hypothetical protein
MMMHRRKYRGKERGKEKGGRIEGAGSDMEEKETNEKLKQMRN